MTQAQPSGKPARSAAARKRPGGSKGGSSVRTIEPQCIATSVAARTSWPRDGLLGVAVDGPHDRGGLVGADRHEAKVERADTPADLAEDRAVAGVPGEEDLPGARGDRPGGPERGVAVERCPPGEVNRGEGREDEVGADARLLPPAKLADIANTAPPEEGAESRRHGGHDVPPCRAARRSCGSRGGRSGRARERGRRSGAAPRAAGREARSASGRRWPGGSPDRRERDPSERSLRPSSGGTRNGRAT